MLFNQLEHASLVLHVHCSCGRSDKAFGGGKADDGAGILEAFLNGWPGDAIAVTDNGHVFAFEIDHGPIPPSDVLVFASRQPVETKLVGGPDDGLQFHGDGTVGIAVSFEAAGNHFHRIDAADHPVHGGQSYQGIGVAAADNGIRQRAAIRQGLGCAVLTRIFIGDQDSFDPFLLDLRAVHDQVCVGVAETFFADDDPIYTQVFHELGRKIAGPLLVKQGHVLVGNYAAHKAEVCAVALQQVVNDRVVQVVVGCVLVTGGNTVAADNGPVHHFRWLHEGGHHVFHVDAVVIGVVEQALALQHVDVGDLGQIWIAPVVFVQGQDRKSVV